MPDSMGSAAGNAGSPGASKENGTAAFQPIVPFNHFEDAQGRLPPGWARRLHNGRIYYQDDNTHTTTWDRPLNSSRSPYHQPLAPKPPQNSTHQHIQPLQRPASTLTSQLYQPLGHAAPRSHFYQPLSQQYTFGTFQIEDESRSIREMRQPFEIPRARTNPLIQNGVPFPTMPVDVAKPQPNPRLAPGPSQSLGPSLVQFSQQPSPGLRQPVDISRIATPQHAPILSPSFNTSSMQANRPPTQSTTKALESRVEFESFSAQRRSTSRDKSTTPDSEEEISDEVSENEESDSSDDESKLGQIEANILDCLGEASQLGYSVPAKFRPPPSSTKGGEKRGKFNGRRPFRRGPMKAAEPTGDIKLRLGWANEAFIENNYEEAEQVIRDIIKINAETHEAWTILSSIQRELGDIPASVNSLAYAAILRPKDEQGWLKCAEYALNQTEGDRASFVDSAYFCYSSAIRANVNSIEGRLGKAEVKFEKGNLVGAVSEFSRVLKKFQPHNLRAVRGLGATYFDLGEFENAKELYKREFDFMRWPQNVSQEFIDWNDVAAYTAVYEKMGDFHAAIWELRSLARWLLGRESEPYFDISDDCEWDLDDARKTKLPEYVVGKFSPATYGEGLPPELRVKLAKCRFELGEEEEAQRHLDYFSYSGKAEHSYIIEYQLLYSDVAEYFMAKGSYQKAIYFFQQLKRVPELTSPSILINIAKCFQSQGLDFMTEDYFSRAIDIDEDNTEARLELAKMCETLGRDEQAFMYVNEVIAIKRNAQRIAPPPPKKAYRRRGGLPELSPEPVESVIVFKKKARYRPRKSDQAEQLREEMARINELQAEHQIVRTELDSMRAGDVESVQRWMEAARNMIDDFRSFKLFYPWDKYARFLGYSKNSRMEPEAPLDPSLAAMADRLSQNIEGGVQAEIKAQAIKVPSDYRGVSFSDWLDTFLEYALCLARHGQLEESYEICESAKDSTIYCHSRDDMFLIHVAWCTCAMLGGDEGSLLIIARFFLKEYQFVTDSYRMFAALSRMCHSPVNYYADSANQKFMLRQVKSMDYALIDQELRDNQLVEKVSYTTKKEDGELIVNDDMDIALIMLYGHILYAGQSYAQALNYFFRAYALDPTSPMINLNIGICYLLQALRRMTHNRQQLILQGMTFLFTYYDSRKSSPVAEEKQEAHYNIARAYHMLGLTHLALPYYKLVLEEPTQSTTEEPLRVDLRIDAAYNLQTIYSSVGNTALANAITERWLVL